MNFNGCVSLIEYHLTIFYSQLTETVEVRVQEKINIFSAQFQRLYLHFPLVLQTLNTMVSSDNHPPLQ